MTTTLPDRDAVVDASSESSVTAQPVSRRRLPRAPRAPRARMPERPGDSSWAAVSTAGTMVAIVCLWVVAQMMFLSSFGQERAQTLLYDDFRTNLASATAPLGPTTPVGDPVALLTIPRLGLSQVVVEGTSSATTMDGPGHLRRTVLPGQVGTSVVIGRAATYGAPFGDLDKLRTGDDITVVMSQGEVHFEVVNVRRAGDPYSQPLAAGATRLVLATAEGSGALASLTPSSALYVDADAPQGFVPPSGLPATVPDSEQVLGTDPGALPLLVLYLALLVALTLAVVAARQRWSAALVWVVSTPIALGFAWATTDVAMRLLPNVI